MTSWKSTASQLVSKTITSRKYVETRIPLVDLNPWSVPLRRICQVLEVFVCKTDARNGFSVKNRRKRCDFSFWVLFWAPLKWIRAPGSSRHYSVGRRVQTRVNAGAKTGHVAARDWASGCLGRGVNKAPRGGLWLVETGLRLATRWATRGA